MTTTGKYVIEIGYTSANEYKSFESESEAREAAAKIIASKDPYRGVVLYGPSDDIGLGAELDRFGSAQ